MTERPANTERNFDNWNFSDRQRWLSYGGCFARVDVRDNGLSPHGG